MIECVREALRRMDCGEGVDIDALCGERVHLRVPLAEVLGLTDELAALQQDALREDPLAGLLLQDRYQLRDCVGRGAMGVVYLAEDRVLRREVAVKILDARLFHDEAAEQRFRREGEALAALQHPNVVAVYDRGRTPEGIHFLVMERLEGATLAVLLGEVASGRSGAEVAADHVGFEVEHWPRQVATWGRELADGLAAAHRQMLVHRDVKPSNVFVTRSGRAVLIDFGIASRRTGERLTATRTTLGTPWYMPPEQVASGGLQPARPTLDVYGLGATLYHLLAGRPPYEGDAAAVLAALPHRDPTPLLRVRPELPRDLVAVVEKCLERDPRRRYPDAAGLVADLDAFLRHEPVTARPLSPLGRRLRVWRRAPARPIAVVAVTVTLLVGGIALPILHRQQQRELAAKKLELYRRLPGVLAVEGWPDERVVTAVREENQSAIAQLDAILELDPRDLPARLWRACLHFDLGDRSAAQRDLAFIADQRDSAYFRALVERYANADPGQQGAFAVPVDGLPEPVTAQELYVQGAHELRNRHVPGFAERADELLARAAATYLPARDLRLLSIGALVERVPAAERPQLLRLLYDEAVALEEVYGVTTARTQGMRGVALLLMKRYEEALAPLERSLELRPERHSPHQNLGVALRRLGRLDEAEQHLREALRLRPFAWKSRYTLVLVLRDRGELDAALDMCEDLTTEGLRGRLRDDAIGSIHLARAVACREWDRRCELAELAAESYRAALRGGESPRLLRNLAIAEALTVKGRAAAFTAYARAIHDVPPDAYQLANLAFMIPSDGLPGEAATWLTILLERLAIEKAGNNEQLRDRLEQEIEAMLARIR